LIDAVETGQTSQTGVEIAPGIEKQILKIGSNLFIEKVRLRESSLCCNRQRF
jgi:hypothetical protein